MAEYIDKEKLYQYLNHEVEWNNNRERLTMMEVVFDFPPADVAPVKHGKWISDGSKYFCCNCGNYALWENERWRVMEGDLTGLYQVKSENCPYCGAKMDL